MQIEMMILFPVLPLTGEDRYEQSFRGEPLQSLQAGVSELRLTIFFFFSGLEGVHIFSARCASPDVERPRSLKIREYWVVYLFPIHFRFVSESLAALFL